MLTGNDRRLAFRAALKASPEWPDYRRDNNLDLGNMTMDQFSAAFSHCYPDWTLEQWAETAAANGEPAADSPALSLDSPVNSPVNRPANTAAAKLVEALTELAAGQTAPIDRKAVAEIAKHEAEHATAAITDSINGRLSEMEEMISALSVPTRVVIVEGNLEKPVEGLSHHTMPRLLNALNAKQPNGLVANIWLAGPAGSGKTHATAQAAKALDMPFYLHGSMSMPHEVMGFVDAAGLYHTTGFRQAFEHGGVCLLDECDSYDPNVTTAINGPLANGLATFPDSPNPVHRHPNFRCVAAGNTWGTGATAEYVGRNRLDAAFLSRFPVKIEWTYDENLELAMTGNREWTRRVQRARQKARAAGLKIMVDPRHSMAGAALIAAGFTEDEAADLTFLAGLSPDQRNMLA